MTNIINHKDPYERKKISALNTEIAYIDTGAGEPVVFLHGNPTSSYLWRNVIPHVEKIGRCLAPDLVGFGDSGSAPDGKYRFVDHARYLDEWFDALNLTNVTLVGHDWGGALGFYWASRHPEKIRNIIYMETFVQPLQWDHYVGERKKIFELLRSPEGEKLIIDENIFVEKILPSGIIRKLSTEEFNHYNRRFSQPGKSRLPTLIWPREIPIDGEPKDVYEIVEGYSQWLASTTIPKLFINADPGRLLIGKPREFCRTWLNQKEVTVRGFHFIQEDSPHEIGEVIAHFLSN